MMPRVQDLCRKLKPVLGRRVDGLWAAYLADSDPSGRADIEQTLELLAAKHLGQGFMPDRAPFPPPPRAFATEGDITIGQIQYGQQGLFPFRLRSDRLREHLLIAGRSGSGKTNLAFVLIHGIMQRGIHVLALDWKRGYRDLRQVRPDLQVFTVGRGVAPLRFNPLIPPPGCEPNIWIKLITEIIAASYLGGDGVISLLVAGLDQLYSQFGVFSGQPRRWPTVDDLLGWLRSTKLKGRAALWQASAERILLALTYGEFGGVLRTQDNTRVLELLDKNVVLEMDGLSSSSDRAMFSESLTAYLYRYRLAQGSRATLTNVIVLEEAHHVLHARQPGASESVLENSIRMIRQYGIGYIFIDQSASLLSRVAFANSYATLALSQKLRADVQVMSSSMNLSDEQQEALSTLPIGSVVVRLADEHPEPFLVKIPRLPLREGAVSDDDIRIPQDGDSADSMECQSPTVDNSGISPLPLPDRTLNEFTHPPSPEVPSTAPTPSRLDQQSDPPPKVELTRESIRFLADLALHPLSTTVARYERLHLSRRRGNAVRTSLVGAKLIEAAAIPTRAGQVVLYELTDAGRVVCIRESIDTGPAPRSSLEHRYWVRRIADDFESQGFEVALEARAPDGGFIDVVAQRGGTRVAIEVETGKSDVAANLQKLRGADFDRVILLATSPDAIAICRKAIAGRRKDPMNVELQSWLDLP